MHEHGNAAAVAFHLGKVTGRDELLEDLHQILYGRKGKVQIPDRHCAAVAEQGYCTVGPRQFQLNA